MKTIEELAKFLHDRYEHHAKENEWDTQTSCKTEFKDLPDANKKTMIAVASDLNALLTETAEKQKKACYEEAEKAYQLGNPFFRAIRNTPLVTQITEE